MSEDTLQIAAATSSHPSLSTECESVKVPPPRKGLAFWMAFLAVLVSLALSVLDMCATPTALPTIIEDLQGGDKFIWVGAAYGLSSTAVLMLCGRFADIFGRRPVMLASIGLFALGSALAGAAQNMDMMIAARGEFTLLWAALMALTPWHALSNTRTGWRIDLHHVSDNHIRLGFIVRASIISSSSSCCLWVLRRCWTSCRE